MAKIFKGDVNFGFVINQTGAQPLDSRSVVQSYEELLKAETFGTAIYNGMTVAIVDEQKVYMLVDKTKATSADGWKEVGAGGAISVETYAEAVVLATDDNIGQVIYVKTKSSYDADGDGAGVAIEYDAAPYIVIGVGSLQKLAASTASGDIEGDVAELTTKVSGLETTVGNAESGLVKDVADLKDAMDALPETFVTDVKVGETSLVTEGVADLSNFVQKEEGKGLSTNDYTTTEKEKLGGIAAGAEVNVVKSVDTTGALGLDESGKLTVSIPEVEVPFQSVDADDKVLTLGEGGVLKSDLTFTKENIEGAEYLVVKGKDGVEIGKVATAEFTVDGVLDSVDWSEEEGKENILVLTFNTGANKTPIEVDFGKYVDAYSAGNGLTLTDKAFAVDFTKVEAAGAAATVKYEIETKLADYAKSADVYSKTDADDKFVALENYVAYTQGEKDKLADIAEGAEVNVVKSVDTAGVLGLDESGKLSADLSAYALSAGVYTKDAADDKFVALEGYVAYSNEEKTKLDGIEAGAEVNILEVFNVNDGETVSPLTVTDKAVTLDLSAYAKSDDVESTLESYAKSANVYTKTESDALLANKADASALDSYIAKSAISGTAGEGGTITGASTSLAFTEDGVLEVNTMSSADIMNVINANA